MRDNITDAQKEALNTSGFSDAELEKFSEAIATINTAIPDTVIAASGANTIAIDEMINKLDPKSPKPKTRRLK